MILMSESIDIAGNTYSQAMPGIYKEFERTNDAEIFERLIFDIILKKNGEDRELIEYISSLDKHKQRMAGLTLIDGNNVLWAKMNAFVKGCANKQEHNKDVLKIMSKFIKDGEAEIKQFGEVMTPIRVVRRMLDKLPKSVWSNPHLKWLDPCNGAGTFPHVIIYRLMVGLAEWEPDIEKRYRHIVENMIYTCELQSRNVFLWLVGVDPKDEYTTNSYWGSFTDAGFDYHMKNVWKVSKFDIIVGNPPYQRPNSKTHKLWVDFLEKCRTMCDMLCFINPTLMCDGLSNRITATRKGILPFLAEIDFSESSVFHEKGIGESVCLYLLDMNRTPGPAKVIREDGSSEISQFEDIIYKDGRERIKFSILEKVSKGTSLQFFSDIRNTDGAAAPNSLIARGIASATEDDIFKYKLHHSASNTLYSKEKMSHGKLKLVFNYSGGYYDPAAPERYMFITEGIAGKQVESVLIESKEEGEKLRSAYSKKIFRYFIAKEKTGGFNTGIFKLPKLDMSIDWTDQLLYDRFGLTAEEIAAVEEFIK